MSEPAMPTRATDDSDVGWGESAEPDDDERRLLDDRPPHHEERD